MCDLAFAVYYEYLSLKCLMRFELAFQMTCKCSILAEDQFPVQTRTKQVFAYNYDVVTVTSGYMERQIKKKW